MSWISECWSKKNTLITIVHDDTLIVRVLIKKNLGIRISSACKYFLYSYAKEVTKTTKQLVNLTVI